MIGSASSARETLSEFSLLLGPCPVLLQNNHHLAKTRILLVNSRFTAHLDNLSDLVFTLSILLIQTWSIFHMVLVRLSIILLGDTIILRF